MAACGTLPKGSVVGSEGGALKGPEIAVKGATDFDQRWIDETTEAGIAALGWQRPGPRPPEWDKPLSKRPSIAAVVEGPPPAKKKPRWRDRFLRKGPAAVEGG